MRVFSPVAKSTRRGLPLARRPATLQGRTIGILHNHNGRFDHLSDELEQLAKEVWSPLHVVRLKKPKYSSPLPDDQMAALVECDAVINGIGN